MMGLHMHGVSHAFGAQGVLDRVSVTVPAGELVCLLGPSGCGKTTLLRLAAGLERLQHGEAAIDGRPVAGPGLHIPPEDRRVGLMFQDYALFPHLSVLDNVGFGLHRQSRQKARTRAMAMLEQVGMDEHAGKHPHMLSGGQQQRVALARALAPEPRVVLLDEPFSGLDSGLRARIRAHSLGVLKANGVATLMVTHDPEEAMFMADRIKVLGHGGRVLQSGRPADIYFKPRDPFVAQLFGPANRLRGVVVGGMVLGALGRIPAEGWPEGCRVEVLIRPEGLLLGHDGRDGGVPVEIISTHLLGHSSLARLRLSGGEEFQVRVSGDFDPEVEDRLWARVDGRHAFVFAEDGGAPHPAAAALAAE